MENQFNEIPDLPTNELREGIPQIQIDYESEEEIDDALWLDFQSGDDAEGIKSGGLETYVISPITEQNLFSDKYLNCTGVVGIGRDKTSGKEIAFISHQDPEYFINKGPEFTKKFEDHLRETLKELISRSEEGSIEVVVFGGNSDQTDAESIKNIDYIKSLELLNVIISNVMGSKPTIAHGPNIDGGAIDVSVDTQSRKIVIS